MNNENEELQKIHDALLASKTQLGKDAFKISLTDYLPDNVKLSEDLTGRVLRYSGFLKDIKLIVDNTSDENIIYTFAFPVYNNLRQLIIWASKEEKQKVTDDVIRTAIDLLSLISLSRSDWFEVSVGPKLIWPDIDGEVYIIRVSAVSKSKLRNLVNTIVKLLLVDALSPLKFQPHVRVRMSKEMKENKKNINQVFDTEDPTEQITAALKMMDLLTEEGYPTKDILTFIRQTKEYIKKKLLHKTEKKPKQCPYCGGFFIPIRQNRMYCYDPKCKVYYHRKKKSKATERRK